MSAASVSGREHLVRVIAVRHGITVQKDDPLFAVGTICEAYIDEAGHRFDELIKNRIADLEAAAGRIEKRTGQLVAQEFNDHLAAVRNSLQMDITLAGAKANEIVYRIEQANGYPMMVRWTAIGLALAVVIFAIGVVIGWGYVSK
jgi:CHASE3 domain sensor protein